VFDWTVPREWNIRDAFIKRSTGERLVDFKACNLHVVGYSTPVHETMPLSELKKHLHSLPDHPDWVPYRTSYYNENWGFCMAHKELVRLPEDAYEVCIDASLEDGHLTLAECFLEGESPEEVLLSCHICHPSLCNDNLSGIALATFLARFLGSVTLRYSYRFLFIPGTIGSITWLALNEERAHRIKHGLVITSVGDPGGFTYKRSRRGNAEIDAAVEHVLKQWGSPHEIVDFSPYGYDERQYCSPGFNLPVGCLQRTPHGRYPEYHTSADNLGFVQPASLAESLSLSLTVLDVLETNRVYRSTNPKCEPQLGRRGLYNAIGGRSDSVDRQMAMLWVLNLSDGRNTLLDIANRAEMPVQLIGELAVELVRHGLLRESHA
jgi:aminopeptidase-like protein